MHFGVGQFTYQVVNHWANLPAGWKWGWIPAVACDSQDRVYVYSRSAHPLVIFDRNGNFLASWGEDILKDAHGIFIDAADNVYCTDRDTHCVRKFNPQGQLVLTLGSPGQPGSTAGQPFNRPTDLAIASNGELFISDGYGNSRVHKYSPDGQLLLSWGEPGGGPGQFNLSHCVRVDKYDRVWVCDRGNNRIQIFDLNGCFLKEWRGLSHPDMVCFDPLDDVVYVTEMDHRFGIYTLDGSLITQWDEFIGWPHGVCVDSRGDLYITEVNADGRLQKYIRQR